MWNKNMSDKEMAVKGLDWIINHKKILYATNKDFDDNELRLLDRTSLLMDRAFIIQKSSKWSAIPLMLEILYSQLTYCWEYMTEDEWKSLVDKIVTGLSDWKDAVESEDKESLYESMITSISYSGNALLEARFSGKGKTTPEEWETERAIDERTDRVEKDLNEIKRRVGRLEEASEFLFSRIK
jgi:hypothetical protein